ncbi:nickel transporter [Streptomyces sp. B93]|uniref:nickel transporter n=1 Tax=Streptomyces sp. B93 TaxID=2824875 RepID=UPI001B397563|nr:nickel transporter [Streptomyces sp. B93]MBQ1092043.1 nickel transporter [Streptomyces sp. B93]
MPRRAPATVTALLTALVALLLLPVTAASAHPLGNFTVNRYDGLVAAPGELRVRHVEDLAEIPATQAAPDVERLGLTEWARRRCATAARDSAVTVGGRAVPLTVADSHARVRPGQAGLDTLRLECGLRAPLPEGDSATAVGFRAARDDSGPGWREITARGDRMTLTASDVPQRSVSRELTAYPEKLLSSPADTTTASLRVRPGGPPLARGAEHGDEAPGAAVLPRGADRWTRALDSLVARQDLTVGFAAFALVVAGGLGALHALAPGHGKTLMAATAAAHGGRARLRHVLPLAASVTVTHTLGVVALGLLVTAGSVAAPSVIAWLGIASGALVTVAGATLVRRALRTRHHDHGHAHAHGHDHDHDHDHSAGHTHTHGGHTHTHPTAPTLRGTILLGFAGGLVPSPSAVVVLVGAAALGQAWFGLLLVVAYGAGLALTLTAAGFAVVKVGGGVTRVLARRPRWTAAPGAALVRRFAPLGSAFVVVALGAGLVLRGAASALG